MSRHATTPLWDDQSASEKLGALQQLVDDLFRYTLRDAFAYMRQILHEHTPSDAKETQDVAQILQLMDEHATLFSPLCEVGHFTGSALVLDPQTMRVLLHYHKSLQRWLQFGGHPDYETDMAAVAMREAQEESGLPHLRHLPNVMRPRPIDIDVHAIPPTKNRPEHLHLDLRYILTTSKPDAIAAGQDESQQLQWFSREEITNGDLKLDTALHRLIDKGFQRLSGAS